MGRCEAACGAAKEVVQGVLDHPWGQEYPTSGLELDQRTSPRASVSLRGVDPWFREPFVLEFQRSVAERCEAGPLAR